jgi:hypothetical protein
MRLLRFIIFIVVICLFIFVIALLLPSKVTVAKSVLIKASPQEIENQIINFERWKGWYPAFKDQNILLIKIFENTDKPSAIFKDQSGKKITFKIVSADSQLIHIEVNSSTAAKVNYQFLIAPRLNDESQLTWNVNTDLGWYPWNRIQGIFLDKFSGVQYESALENLKRSAEN